MAYEASEIMTAVALQYTTKALKSIETVDDLQTMIEFGKNNIAKLNIQFGSDPIKNGFLANLDSTKDKKVEDYYPNEAISHLIVFELLFFVAVFAVTSIYNKLRHAIR